MHQNWLPPQLEHRRRRSAHGDDLQHAGPDLVVHRLRRHAAPQRKYTKRDLFNGIQFVLKTGCQWRALPNDFPPWAAVYLQVRGWTAAGIYEDISRVLRFLVRILEWRDLQPSNALMDGRTLQSTLESGARAGYDG